MGGQQLHDDTDYETDKYGKFSYERGHNRGLSILVSIVLLLGSVMLILGIMATK